MLDQALEHALQQLSDYHQSFGDRFPELGRGKTYELTPNTTWVTGFWTGLLWLAHAATAQGHFRKHAENLLPSFRSRLDQFVHIDHDLGFLYLLSARAQWQLTGDEDAHQLALRAADELAKRFHDKGKFIQAWGEVGQAELAGLFIIDCMMNIPLLFWASAQSGEDKYREIGIAHAETTRTNIVRPDGSTFHTFWCDPDTGKPIEGRTHQGFSSESLWARGQAWAIYGFALAYQWTQKEEFLETATRLAQRFWNELPDDRVPTWDLRLPPDSRPHLDSSASAIAACGLLRLARVGAGNDYRNMAITLLETLVEDCMETDPNARGLLRFGTAHAPACVGINVYLPYGDYYFLEALLSVQNKAPDFWGPLE